MTPEQMREFLDGHRHASKKIIALQMEIKALALTSDNDEELQRLTNEISQCLEKMQAVRDAIRLLEDDNLESVLLMRYINHLTIEQTADALNYARQTIKDKTNKAIAKLCPKLS